MLQMLLNSSWPKGEETVEMNIFGWENLLFLLLTIIVAVLLIMRFLRRK